MAILFVYPTTVNSGGGGVAPTVNDATFNINDGYTNGQVVGTITFSGSPSPTLSITAGNTGTAFAINSSTGQITVADSSQLDNGTHPSYSLTINGTNGVSPDDTGTATINVAAAGSETFLTSATFVNTSGSTQASTIHTFGQAFKKGVVDATTEKFVLRDHDTGNEIPHTIDNGANWLDDTYAHGVFHAELPSIAGSGNLTVDFYKTAGTYSQSAARTTSDITSHDYKLKIAAFTDNADSAVGSGNFTCAVNDYIGTSLREYSTNKHVYGVETWGFFKDDSGGAADTQMMAQWMIDVLSDSAGDYAGTRVTAYFGMPYATVENKRAFRGKVSLWDGATKVKDFAEVYTFTSSNVNTTNNTISITGTAGHELRSNMAARFTNSGGSLFGGVTSGKLYYLHQVSSGVYTIHASSRDANFDHGDNVTDITSAGSGTHTVTIYDEQPYWVGHGVLDREADEFYIDMNKPTVIPQYTETERAYWLETGLLPPWSCDDPTDGITVDASYDDERSEYFPMAVGQWRPVINNTGGDLMIGVDPEWIPRWFFNQDEAGWKNVKTNSIVQMHTMRSFVLDEDTGNGLYCGNHGPLGDDTTPYENVGAPTPTRCFFGVGIQSSDIPTPPIGVGEATPGSGSQEGVFNDDQTGPEGSHTPCTGYFGYLFTGRRHHLRAMWGALTRQQFSAAWREVAYNGNNYLLPHFGNQQRADGTKFRDFMLPGFIGEDSGEKQMARALAQEYANYYHDAAAHEGQDWVDGGYWYPPDRNRPNAQGGSSINVGFGTDGDGPHWAHESTLMRFHYQHPSWVWASVLYRGNSKFQEMGQAAVNAAKNFGEEVFCPLSWLNCYSIFKNPSAGDWTTPAPEDIWIFLSDSTMVSATTDGTFTFIADNEYSASLTVGDKFQFWDSKTLPANLSYGTTYKILTKPTNTTFTISLATDNVQINPATAMVLDGPFGTQTAWKPLQPSTGIVSGANADQWCAGTMMVAGWGKSAGYTDMDTAVTNLNTRIDAQGQHPNVTFNKTPKFYIRGTVEIA